MLRRIVIPGLLAAGLAGCGPSYSPDTYSTTAVQQANKVEQGIIVGVRDVAVSAAGTVGTVTGAAAGGIAGSQVGSGPTSAFAALGGSLVGGIAGSAAEHVTSDAKAYEYIVRKANGDLISVTQSEKTPLALGQHVLVIAGNQARVVQDYTVPALVASKPAKPPEPARPAPATRPDGSADAAKPDAPSPEPVKADTSPDPVKPDAPKPDGADTAQVAPAPVAAAPPAVAATPIVAAPVPAPMPATGDQQP